MSGFLSHCQFGDHGEPFLWNGSGNDAVDLAIMELLQLVEINAELAEEASEFIHASLVDAKNLYVEIE